MSSRLAYGENLAARQRGKVPSRTSGNVTRAALRADLRLPRLAAYPRQPVARERRRRVRTGGLFLDVQDDSHKRRALWTEQRCELLVSEFELGFGIPRMARNGVRGKAVPEPLSNQH